MDWTEVLKRVLNMESEQIEKIAETFAKGNPILLKGTDRGNGRDYFVEVVPIVAPHCKTCQCLRVDAELPAHPAHPEIKRGKSWHHG